MSPDSRPRTGAGGSPSDPLIHRPAAMPPVGPPVPPAEPAAPPAAPPEAAAPPAPGPAAPAWPAAPPAPGPAVPAWPAEPVTPPDLFQFPGSEPSPWSGEPAFGSPGPSGADEPLAAASFPPYDLADVIRRLQGVDVSDVPVSRGPEADLEARMAGARAFTRDGEVVLPPGAGPVERPVTRALLAHELTHAAQQRALGPSLPAEDSEAGRALEAEAVAAERFVLGAESASAGQSGPQRLFHARPPRRPASWSQPAAAASAASIQRDPEENAGIALEFPAQAPAPGPALSADQEARPEPEEATGDALGPQDYARLLDLADQRLLDLDDSVAVGQLADGIYRRVQARLRRELLVDRERSGLLSDFR